LRSIGGGLFIVDRCALPLVVGSDTERADMGTIGIHKTRVGVAGSGVVGKLQVIPPPLTTEFGVEIVLEFEAEDVAMAFISTLLQLQRLRSPN